MDNIEVVYTGCFINPKKLEQKIKKLERLPLKRTIERPHVTFEYKPSSVDFSLFGEKVSVTATGYGNDGENEGLFVTLETDNDSLKNLIKKIENPHITLSVSENGKPVNTKNLSSVPIEPIKMTAVFGAFVSGKGIVVTSAN